MTFDFLSIFVVLDKLAHLVEIVLDLSRFFFLLDESELLLNGSFYFVQFLEVLLYLSDLAHQVLVEIHDFPLEAVVISEYVLCQERQQIGIVVQVVPLVDLVDVALWTNQLALSASLLNAVVILFADLALGADF